MTFSITASALGEVATSWLVVFHVEDADSLSAELAALDELLDGAISRVQSRGDLTGKLSELVIMPDTPQIAADRVLIAGLGKVDSFSMAAFRKSCGAAIRKIAKKSEQTLAVQIPEISVQELGADATVELVAETVTRCCSPQNLYQKEQTRFPFTSVQLLGVQQTESAANAIRRGTILGEAINLTRELVNRNPDDIYPDTFATRAVEEVSRWGVRGEILDQHHIAQEKMGALLAVAKGSTREPRVVYLHYDGAGPDAPIVGLVGKGVTFDSGGLSIKPSDSMISMKADMAGAATVLGIIQAVARMKLSVNVVGVLGLVENMTGGSAYKLGDVLTARNGTTIEVHNTDAEGRLVLADALSYAVDHKVDCLIDFATLTGACVVALGEEVVGAFTNHQAWCDAVLNATSRTGEEIWQLPMHDFYADQLKSQFADCKNVGTRWGGAITAAKFLEKFVNKVPWVHLDIAGPAFADSETAERDPGGTGVMVRSIVQLLSGTLPDL